VCPAHWGFFYDDALYKSTLSNYLSIYLQQREREIKKANKESTKTGESFWKRAKNEGESIIMMIIIITLIAHITQCIIK